MKTTGTGKFGGIIVLLATLAIVLLLNVNQVHALSCLPPQNIFVAAYEQGKFTGGFVIEHRGTGNFCDTRPVVSERTDNLQNAFLFASQNLKQEVSSGVYQLSTRCWAERWEEWCAKETTLEQLSNNPSELARYKSEWQLKENEALRNVSVEKWTTASIMIVISLLAILWPWILLRIKKNIKHIGSLFTFAIVIQIIVSFFLQGFSYWSFELWRSIASISSLAIIVSVVIEIIYLIYQKVKMRKSNIS